MREEVRRELSASLILLIFGLLLLVAGFLLESGPGVTLHSMKLPLKLSGVVSGMAGVIALFHALYSISEGR